MPGYKFPSFMDPEMAARAGAAISRLSGEQPTQPEALQAAELPNPPPDPSEVPVMEEPLAETSSTDDDLEGMDLAMRVEKAMDPQAVPPMKMGAAVVGGRNRWLVGGEENIKTATRTAPSMIAEGLDEEGAIAKEQATEVVDAYKKANMSTSIQRAMTAQKDMQDQAGLAQRYAEIDQKLKGFTSDLMKTKNMWANPQSIMATIGFAMMSFASNSPIGTQMMMRSIQQDWENRKAVADTTLGEMRSNIGGYRQLMGDRKLGDQAALAESYRAFAMELDRIGAHYKGPAAQAFIKKAKGELLGNAVKLEMGLMKDTAVLPHMTQPGVAQAYRNIPGYENIVPRAPTSQLSGTGYAKPNGQSAGQSQTQTEVPQELRQLAEDLERRMPGSSKMLGKFYEELNKEAQARAGGPYVARIGSPAQLKELDKLKNEARLGKSEIAKNSTVKEYEGKRQLISMVQKDWTAIKDAFGNDKTKIALFIGGMSHNFPATDHAWEELWSNAGMGNLKPDQRSKAKAAAQRFKNLLSEAKGNYYSQKAGAALNEIELANLKQVISSSSDPIQIDAFLNSQSNQMSANLKSVVMTSPSKFGAYLYLLERGISPGLVPHSGVTPRQGTVKRGQ